MAHDRRFRFGIQLSTAPSGADWATAARRAEDLGYATLFMPDHFGDQLAPVPALMAAADATTELRVGRPGVRQRLQAPGGAGQGAGHDRRALGRSARGGHRRRLDEERLRPVRHPDGPARRAGVAHGGGHRRPQGLLRAGSAHLRRRALHDHRLRRPAEAHPVAAAVPHRRRRQARAVHRRPRGGHRRHQPVDPQRPGRRRRRPERRRRRDRPEARLGEGGRRRPLRRPRDQPAAVRRASSPTTAPARPR